ncbi:hypothetical protein [Streptomyces sp. HUAS TT20]|uniref:hypothetical protein n=1 Tax=Streptomyces sp. HUAS TT20 TaxID=3447509 RepID=UPI0021DAD726|nr:hypothetical protein [Streptomyces sp. HUAS 15-9]UXY27027.1 hypothetical protein N8I87_10795 [Streptomyces sp. HUAS 15-9]
MDDQEFAGDRQADAETLRRWEAWASEARTQLAAAGLPVEPHGLDPAVGAGAVVEVDPGADEAGGVYVSWRPAPVLRVAAMRRAMEQRSDDPVLGHMNAIDKAMTEAIRAVLTAGGFEIGDSPNDFAEGTVYVIGPPRRRLLESLGLDAPCCGGAPDMGRGSVPVGGPGPG